MRLTKRTCQSLIIIICIGMIGTFKYLEKKSNDRYNMMKARKIMETDLQDLQTPFDVMYFYNEINLYLYGGRIQKPYVEKILKQQRKLYDNEFLKLNPWDTYHLNSLNEMKQFKQSHYQLLDITQEIPVFSDQNKGIARICVKQENNKNIRIVMDYYLRQDPESGLWKIFYFEEKDFINKVSID